MGLLERQGLHGRRSSSWLPNVSSQSTPFRRKCAGAGSAPHRAAAHRAARLGSRSRRPRRTALRHRRDRGCSPKLEAAEVGPSSGQGSERKTTPTQVRATRTWLGPQGPHAPSNLGKNGIINNNELIYDNNTTKTPPFECHGCGQRLRGIKPSRSFHCPAFQVAAGPRRAAPPGRQERRRGPSSEGRDRPSLLVVAKRRARQRNGVNRAAVIPDSVNHMLRRVCPDLRVVPVFVGGRMGGARICAPLGEERRFATRPVLLARPVVIGARHHPFAQFLQMGKNQTRIQMGSVGARAGEESLGERKPGGALPCSRAPRAPRLLLAWCGGQHGAHGAPSHAVPHEDRGRGRRSSRAAPVSRRPPRGSRPSPSPLPRAASRRRQRRRRAGSSSFAGGRCAR